MKFLKRLENSLIYGASVYPDGDWGQTHLPYEDVFYTADDGVKLHAWFCPNDSAKVRSNLTILYFHGNAGNLSHRAGCMSEWIDRFGVNLFMMDYRGYGRSEGSPDEQGIGLDALASWQVLLDRGIDSQNIVIVGRSLGAAVALELALKVQSNHLIMESGFLSIPAVAKNIYPWLPVSWLIQTKWNNQKRIPDYQGKLLITHGTADRLIPISHARTLFDMASTDQKNLLEVDDADHNDVPFVGKDRYYDAIGSFLSACIVEDCRTEQCIKTAQPSYSE